MPEDECQSLLRRFGIPKSKQLTKAKTSSDQTLAFCYGIEPRADGDDDIHGHQQDSLKPVTFAVLNEVVDQKHSDKEYCDLEAVKVESHGVVAQSTPADNNHERKDKEGDLHTRTNSDTDCEVHFVLDGDGNGGCVFYQSD